MLAERWVAYSGDTATPEQAYYLGVLTTLELIFAAAEGDEQDLRDLLVQIKQEAGAYAKLQLFGTSEPLA